MAGRIAEGERQVGQLVLDEACGDERGVLLPAVLNIAAGAYAEHRALGVQRLTIVDDDLAVGGEAVAGREAVASLVSQLAVLVFRHIRRLVGVGLAPGKSKIGLTGHIEFLGDVPSS